MWTVENETAYRADRTWVRDKQGHHHWVVVVKATFAFEPSGRLSLADEQLPPLAVPEHFDDPERSSLRYEADLVAAKPGTDLLVNAHAHAPHGRPTREVVVGLRFGSMEKTLLVRGQSHYEFGVTGLRVSEPEPFVSRPIRYEHAYGGSDLCGEDPRQYKLDHRNPVGLGVAQQLAHLHGRPAPSIYYPRGDPARVGPAGFGAVAGHWSPRRELAGTYDAGWAREKRPLLPDDYDPRHLLCAPIDQQIPGGLRGGERVGLVNMTPEGAVGLDLPCVGLRATTRIHTREIEHGFALGSVILEPDEQRLLMVWQSSLAVRAPEVDDLHWTRVCEVRA